MKVTRRSFIKRVIGGAAIGSTALVMSNATLGINKNNLNSIQSNAASEYDAVPDDPNKHWGFLIDLSKCNGCIDQNTPSDDATRELPLCTHSCRQYHRYLKASPPQYWIRVYKLDQNFQIDPYFFPKPCQNCHDPPCQRVCPTGATYKRKDGTVVINNNICIGCRICMAACPYETRFFWWNEPVEESPPEHESSPEYDVHHFKGTVSKCDLCVDKAYKGQLPDCVNACPRGVLYYGDLNEDIVSNKFESLKLSETLEKHGGYRYKEEEGTHPSVYYLPPAGQKDIREKGKKGIF